MEYFVQPDSIVRKIWGKSDTILFIFAGSAAEFALNKAVDWLYFTGRLPADPIGRLFSTVSYARGIIFSSQQDALKTIDRITSIHSGVEKARSAQIPGWAYRDVLYMLIHYSIAAYELLERKLDDTEKAELYDVFYRLGKRMQLEDLPASYQDWLPHRELHMRNDLQYSNYTKDLFLQYRKHLGNTRYKVLVEAQKLVLPEFVRKMLGMKKIHWLQPVVPLYKFSRILKMDRLIKTILLPSAYHQQIRELDVV